MCLCLKASHSVASIKLQEMLDTLSRFCSMMKGTPVATCASAGGVVTRLNSVRCLASGFNFSQPTKRDRPLRRERSSQPPAYPEQQWQPRPRDGWQQQQQQRFRQDQEPRQQSRQQTRDRPAPSTMSRFEHQYLVTCHPGLEKVTAADLQQCCQQAGFPADVEVTAPGRVALGSDSAAAGYAAVLHLHSATRVLQLIHQQQLDPSLPAGQTVYDATREAADWCDLLQPQQTLGIHCLHFYNNSNVTNSQLVQRRVRDAVCDAVRDARGVRPAPPQGTPDLPLAFQMLNDNLQLYRDVGGGSLHRRGYRSDSAVHKAALNEAAAAGLMLLTGWQDTCKREGVLLADPMCGSGTLLIEAALIATATAPGLMRDTRANPWPFLHWPDCQQQQWRQLVQAAEQAAADGRKAWRAGGGRILGNDCHAGALKLAAQAATAAGVSDCISLHQGLCGQWQLPTRDASHFTLAVANPPWGLRLLPGEENSYQEQQQGYGGRYNSSSSSDRRGGRSAAAVVDDGGEAGGLVDAWDQLSRFLKDQCAGAEAWVLSGNPEMSRHLGMRASSKKGVRLGGQKTMWLQYSIRERE